MEAIGWIVAVVFDVLLLVFGLLPLWQGWKIFHASWILRNRGIWVPGVIERRIAPGGPFGVYQFTDLTGAIRFANMTGGRVPKVPIVETEIRYDPLGKVPPRHRREWGGETVAAMTLVMMGIALLTAFVALTHGLAMTSDDTNDCFLQGC